MWGDEIPARPGKWTVFDIALVGLFVVLTVIGLVALG